MELPRSPAASTESRLWMSAIPPVRNFKPLSFRRTGNRHRPDAEVRLRQQPCLRRGNGRSLRSTPPPPSRQSADPRGTSVKAYGNRLFIGDWAAGKILIADASNPAQLIPQGTLQLDGYGDGLDVCDTLVFASTGHHRKSGPAAERPGNGHGLEVWDVKDPFHPKRLSVFPFPVSTISATTTGVCGFPGTTRSAPTPTTDFSF